MLRAQAAGASQPVAGWPRPWHQQEKNIPPDTGPQGCPRQKHQLMACPDLQGRQEPGHCQVNSPAQGTAMEPGHGPRTHCFKRASHDLEVARGDKYSQVAASLRECPGLRKRDRFWRQREAVHRGRADPGKPRVKAKATYPGSDLPTASPCTAIFKKDYLLLLFK